MKFFIYFFGIVLFVGSSACTKEEVTKPTGPIKEVSYSFLVAGHVYGDPLSSEIGIYPPFKAHFQSIQEIPKMHYAFYTGDVVRQSNNQTQWDSTIADMDLLGIDYHVAAGNHDRGDLFLDHFGEYYYSFFEGSDLFVILNTAAWNIEGEQKEFLIATLNEAQEASNIFLFCHELIWWSPDSIFQNIGINASYHYPGSSNYWSEISPILTATDKPVYLFSGDLGATWPSSPYAYYHYDNIYFVASGMGRSQKSNYLIVNVYEDGDVKLNLRAIDGDPNSLGDIRDYELP
jgi:hypothetical protein